MEIDCHLNISQRFGRRGKRCNFGDLAKCTRVVCRAQSADDWPLFRERRQDGKTAGPQCAFKLRTRMKLAVHLFARQRQHDTKTKAANARQRQRQADLGRARQGGWRGDRNNSRFGRRKRLLLHRLGKPRQECLINSAIGIRSGLEFAQADL